MRPSLTGLPKFATEPETWREQLHHDACPDTIFVKRPAPPSFSETVTAKAMQPTREVGLGLQRRELDDVM